MICLAIVYGTLFDLLLFIENIVIGMRIFGLCLKSKINEEKIANQTKMNFWFEGLIFLKINQENKKLHVKKNFLFYFKVNQDFLHFQL